MHDNVRLNFNCQDKSSGVLLPSEPEALSKADDAENDNMSDPFFFEKGFYLEAKTGFQPWPGTRLMIEAFTCMNSERMVYWQTRLASNDLTILEVGAGVGIVGACLAAVGGIVLVTDLPVLVEHSIGPNLKRNEHRVKEGDACGKHLDFFLESHEYSRIEDGWAQAVVLDWFRPMSEQLPHKTSSSIDVIVACDCMWMRKLIDPLFSVITTLFQQSLKETSFLFTYQRRNILFSVITTLFQQSLKETSFLFTYQRRNMMGVFIGMEELLERIEQRGWGVECIAWRTIAVEGDGEQDLYLFEITPKNS